VPLGAVALVLGAHCEGGVVEEVMSVVAAVRESRGMMERRECIAFLISVFGSGGALFLKEVQMRGRRKIRCESG